MPKPRTPLEWIEISLAALAVMAAIGYGAYRAIQPTPSGEIVCTQEAKQCPDGSYVGRRGPRCEFASCPSASPSPAESPHAAEWKTYRNEKLAFQFDYSSELQLEEKFQENYWQATKQHFLELNLTGNDLQLLLLVNDAGRGFENFSIPVSEENITIDGIKAEMRTMDEEDTDAVPLPYASEPARGTLVTFEKNSNRFFLLFVQKKNGPDQKETIEKILSTFTFTK